jgi:hypothetical protein
MLVLRGSWELLRLGGLIDTVGGSPCASGPGLGPGPCRQARWGGRGLQGQRRAEGASRAAGCEAPLRLEGPAWTMRGVPARSLSHLHGSRRAWCEGDDPRPWCWRARQRDTAGTACGRSPGSPCAAAAARRTIVRRTRRKLPPRNGETPVEPEPLTAGHPGRSFPSIARVLSSLFTAGVVRPGAPKVRP